MGINLTTNQWC